MMPGKVNDLLYCYHNIRLIKAVGAEASAMADRMLSLDEDDDVSDN